MITSQDLAKLNNAELQSLFILLLKNKQIRSKFLPIYTSQFFVLLFVILGVSYFINKKFKIMLLIENRRI